MGSEAFRRSTLRKKLNVRNYGAVPGQLTLWVKGAIYDKDAEVTTLAVLAPGYWMVVRAKERVAKIEALPGHYLTTDSELALAVAGEPFIYVSKLAGSALSLLVTIIRFRPGRRVGWSRI